MPRTFIAALLIAAATGVASGDEPFYLGGRTKDDLPQLTDDELGSKKQQALLQALGSDPYGHRADDHCRAGCAMQVRSHAMPSNTKHYGGYWVGGGTPHFGVGPTLEEGVFGWDYFGMTFPKQVALNWTHSRYQGGTGAYKTDGPRLRRH